MPIEGGEAKRFKLRLATALYGTLVSAVTTCQVLAGRYALPPCLTQVRVTWIPMVSYHGECMQRCDGRAITDNWE